VFGFGPKTTDSAQNGHADTDEKKSTSANSYQVSSSILLERIVVDSCDWTLPDLFSIEFCRGVLGMAWPWL
jgi:hypothetical protein